jgi:hypothetical protein
MFRWLLRLLRTQHTGDMSQHRLYTTRYEDLCM